MGVQEDNSFWTGAGEECASSLPSRRLCTLWASFRLNCLHHYHNPYQKILVFASKHKKGCSKPQCQLKSSILDLHIYNAVVLSLVPCLNSLTAFWRLFYLILGHFSNQRGPKSKFWSKLCPICSLFRPKTAQYWVKVLDIRKAHSGGVFMGVGANSDHFGTSEDLHRRPGGILGAKLAYFWPWRVPKLPQIGSNCMISVRLTPVGCMVVF